MNENRFVPHLNLLPVPFVNNLVETFAAANFTAVELHLKPFVGTRNKRGNTDVTSDRRMFSCEITV